MDSLTLTWASGWTAVLKRIGNIVTCTVTTNASSASAETLTIPPAFQPVGSVNLKVYNNPPTAAVTVNTLAAAGALGISAGGSAAAGTTLTIQWLTTLVVIPATTTDSDLVTGVAQLLNTSGVGVWNTTGAFQSTDTAIVAEAMPPAPDRAVVITVFPVDESPVDTTGRWLLQIRTRGNPNDVFDALALRGAVKNALSGLKNVTWGATGVSQCVFYTSFPLGQDENVRFEHVTKFWLDLDQAPTSLRPAGGWD